MIKNNIGAFIAILLLCSACDSGTEHSIVLYPDQQSPGFQQFSRQCSSCHRPPMPDTHVASAWPVVVARMQQHRQQRGLLEMNDSERQQVLAYLQGHAKPTVKGETPE